MKRKIRLKVEGMEDCPRSGGSEKRFVYYNYAYACCLNIFESVQC